MQELINKASNLQSKSAKVCYLASLLGGIISISAIGISLVGSNNNLIFGLGGLGSSAALTGIGSITKNSKRQSALLNLLISSQNSASELPVNNSYEYSDHLEDTE